MRRPSTTGRLLGAATWLGFAAALTGAALSVLALHPLPLGDYWLFVLQRGEGPAFGALWGQNEYHLMVLPRLVFGLDELAGWGGRYLVSAAVALVSLAAIAWAGARALAADAELAPRLRRPLAALVAGLAFSTTHAEVVAEPQKLWIPMATACCVLALSLVRGGGIAFALALVLSVLASLSGIVGLLSLPVLAVLMLVGGSLARAAAVAAAGGVAGTLFFIHMTLPPGPAAGLGQLAGNPLPVLLALGRFLGAPLGRVLAETPFAASANAAAATLGLAGALLAALFWIGFLAEPRRHGRAGLWLGIVGLALLWAGSVSLRDALAPGPFVARYDLIVSLFWAALAILALRRWPGAAVVLPLVIALVAAAQVPFGLRAGVPARLNAAVRIAVAAGAADPELDRRRPYAADMERIRPLLAARGLPPFEEAGVQRLACEDPRLAGHCARPESGPPPSVSVEDPVMAGDCAAWVMEDAPLPDGSRRLLGQGAIPDGHGAVQVVDGSGLIVGGGGRWGDDVRLFGRPLEGQSWLAYVRPGATPPLQLRVGGSPRCTLR